MKYWLLILMTFSTFCHAGAIEDCHAIQGEPALIMSCVLLLSEDTKSAYEIAYSDF
jgi:hypothetical protein